MRQNLYGMLQTPFMILKYTGNMRFQEILEFRVKNYKYLKIVLD